MKEALGGLTLRGRCFLAAAIAAGGSAFVLGEKDLLRVGLVLAVIPLIAIVGVSHARYQLTYLRNIHPRRTPVGTDAQVELVLENLSRVPAGTMLLEEHVPPALGPRPRVVVERLGSRGKTTITYGVRAAARGRYRMGPLVVHIRDPFRMCELTFSSPSSDYLTVIPPIAPLPGIRLAGEHTGTGENLSRSVAVHGEDDTATREYRYGDDLRRVHWRSTARAGELMVRREEQPRESKATIIMDTRRPAHIGRGPDSSFEWLVSAAASICLHLRREQYRLRLVSDTGVTIAASETDGEDSLLTYLAEVDPSPRRDMSRMSTHLRRGDDDSLIIALLGRLSPTETDLLSGLRHADSTCIAFLLDTSTWLPAASEQQAAAHQAHQSATLALLTAGWRVVPVERGADLASLWPHAARRNQGFAARAALAETISSAADS